MFEVGGDLQKLLFKQRSDSRGRHPTGCLFALMRHPNYSGEILIWWGTFIIAIPTFGSDAAGWSTILSPLFTMAILLFLSGMPSAEGDNQARFMKTPSNRAEYEAYRARTSPILPVPSCIYALLPRLVRQLFCCEFPMYECSEAAADDSESEAAASVPKTGGTAAPPAGAGQHDVATGSYQATP